MALRVPEVDTVVGLVPVPLVQLPPLSVGVEPSCVEQNEAPEVELEMVTDCAPVYVPAAGENVGVAAVGTLLKDDWKKSGFACPKAVAQTRRNAGSSFRIVIFNCSSTFQKRPKPYRL